MRASSLVRRNLTYYWRTNLAVAAGVATAVAVLAGALLVGDSVRASLRDLFLLRLGNTDSVVSTNLFFREKLAEALPAGCPLIALQGMVTHQESNRRGAGVLVYGVDERFWRFHGRNPADYALTDRQVLVGEVLARELAAKPGDGILVRIEKPSATPAESLHGRKEDLGETIRFSMRRALPTTELGEFSLRPTQAAVRAVFVPLRRLQRDLEQPAKANTILTAAGPIEKLVREHWALEDLGLRLRVLEGRGAVTLESDGGLLSDRLADAARAAAGKLGLRTQGIFTYLANAIRVGRREIPYSLVSAVDQYDAWGGTSASSIVLNDWAARDLGARPGDEVSLDYYYWTPAGRLETRTAQFRLKSAVPIAGAAADRDLAPHYPGITDSDNLSDWDPPFPLDLKRVRPKDEDYWEKYRTTPKGFILLGKGQELWQSRFGKLTSLRFTPPSLAAYEKALRDAIDPLESGIAVYPARSQGLEASRGATDFGEYFVYFSFFLVAAALLLAGLFFKLGIEQRLREVGLLRAVGFPPAAIRGLFLREGIVLAAAGSLAGSAGAVGYGALILHGLRTWWIGAVGTEHLRLHLTAASLAAGVAGGIAAAVLAIWWTLRGLDPASPRSLVSGSDTGGGSSKALRAGVGSAVLGFGLLAAAAAGRISQEAGFFGAGALLLAALLCFQWVWLSRQHRRLLGGLPGLGFRNAAWRPGRSLVSVSLIASAVFILVAVEAFRRPEQKGPQEFPYLAESLLPVVQLSELGDARFVPFRLRPGDDASCLNLYQPRNPRVMGAPAEFLRRADPWRLLESAPEAGGAIPAIADANSMTYVLHRKVGDEIRVGPARLRLVGALDHSIFQGELIISEANFVRAFPEVRGYRFFLLDRAAELEEKLTDYGFDVTPAADRLAGFDRVENTYLSTFQALGGLGLALGTLGLAAVLLRNILERRRELALLRAVGYRPRDLAVLVVAENAWLLAAGMVTGASCALLAITPAFLARGGHLAAGSIGLLLAAVLATGTIASLAAVAAAVRSPLLPALRAE